MNLPLTGVRAWGPAQISELPLEELVEQWARALSTPVSLVILGAGFFGLFVGWLMGRGRRHEPVDSGSTSMAAGEELRWRHEKLVLWERQEEEKRTRFDRLFAKLGGQEVPRDLAIELGLFRLAETMRDWRQRVGTDFSRVSLVREQLERLSRENPPRPEAVATCEEIAGTQRERLESLRDALRPVALQIGELEGAWKGTDAASEEKRSELKQALESWRDQVRDLPRDWHVLTDEADRKIREVLGAGKEPEFDAIRNVLLVDGGMTESLETDEEVSPAELAEMLIDRLAEPDPGESDNKIEETEAEFEESSPEPETRFAVGRPSIPLPLPTPVPLTPDTSFRPPENGADTPANGNGSVREEETAEDLAVSGETIEEEAEEAPGSLVAFCGNDPALWGQEVYRGSRARARALTEIPGWASFVSIRRLDTGEAVFAPIEMFRFANAELTGPVGFNGSNEEFYGARHLGLYSEQVPNEVETRFTYGGWGFGHRVSQSEEMGESLQAAGWEGEEIPSDTVFEIVFHSSLPDLGEGESLIDCEASVSVS